MLLEMAVTWTAVAVAVVAVVVVAPTTLTATLAVVAVLVAALLARDVWRRRFWWKHGIPIAAGAKPLLGHMLEDINYGCYRFHKAHESYLATKGAPLVCRLPPLGAPLSFQVHSVELSNRVLVKDFEHFVDRRKFESDDVSKEFLTNLSGAKWKAVRSLMSPAFTSGKLKNIFNFMEVKSHTLVSYLTERITENHVQDMENIVQKYNIDTVGSTVFGIDMNLLHGENTGLAEAVENLLIVGFLKDMWKVQMMKKLPNLSKMLGIRSWYLYVVEAVRSLITERLKSEEKHDDFLELMLNAKRDAGDSGVMTETTVVSSAVIFLFAGFDTTTSTVCLILHALAMHTEHQKTLREQLQELKKEDGKLQYQDVMENKYLDAFVNETMRMHPPGHAIEHQCTKDYQFPGTDVVIKKGDFAVIPAYSFHYDPEFFSEPEVFNPDRFLPENKASIKYGTFLPFGIGPRMCIAQRFALMTTKLTIAQLVLNFDISYPEGHPGLQYSDKIGVLRSKPGNSHFKLERIPA